MAHVLHTCPICRRPASYYVYAKREGLHPHVVFEIERSFTCLDHLDEVARGIKHRHRIANPRVFFSEIRISA